MLHVGLSAGLGAPGGDEEVSRLWDAFLVKLRTPGCGKKTMWRYGAVAQIEIRQLQLRTPPSSL